MKEIAILELQVRETGAADANKTLTQTKSIGGQVKSSFLDLRTGVIALNNAFQLASRIIDNVNSTMEDLVGVSSDYQETASKYHQA